MEKKLITDSQVLTEFLGYNKKDLEFDRVINSIDTVDQDYGR